MQINVGSSYSDRPVQLPAQPGLSPEEKNKQQNELLDALAAQQASEEAKKTAQRTALVDYSAAKNRQDNIDLYISLSSGSEVKRRSGLDLADVRDLQQRHQLAETLATLAQAKNNPLQQRIEAMTGSSNTQGLLFSTQA